MAPPSLPPLAVAELAALGRQAIADDEFSLLSLRRACHRCCSPPSIVGRIVQVAARVACPQPPLPPPFQAHRGMNSAPDLRSMTSPASKMKRSVKVRPKAVLNAVLAEAGLPEVKYKTYASYRGRVGATVYFWPSQSRSSAASVHMAIHGEPAVDAAEAMQNAATRCLEHLQDPMSIEFDCPQMQKIKTKMKYLSSSVGEKNQNIKDLKIKVEKKEQQVKALGRGWGSFADDVLGSAGRIDKVAVNYLPSSSSPVEGDVTWDCYGLTQEADKLNYLSMMSTDAVTGAKNGVAAAARCHGPIVVLFKFVQTGTLAPRRDPDLVSINKRYLQTRDGCR